MSLYPKRKVYLGERSQAKCTLSLTPNELIHSSVSVSTTQLQRRMKNGLAIKHIHGVGLFLPDAQTGGRYTVKFLNFRTPENFALASTSN